VVKSTNALASAPTWQTLSNGLQSAWVSSLAIDPQDPSVVYCSYSNYGVAHILKTNDGGQSWFSIDGIDFDGVPDIPVHWIAIRPCNRKQLYAGTELGVFVSENGGGTWAPANLGLAHTLVESLDFQDDNTLAAFTFGRGLFLSSLVPCDGVVATPSRAMINP
jgi:photosystem II stability/assembly factor-like uncharacterized protein